MVITPILPQMRANEGAEPPAVAFCKHLRMKV
jgi:hypothetical protein